MALRCDYCGKGAMHGHNVSHSKRRTKKIFKPNLHSARVYINGVNKKLRLCTKCLRSLKRKPLQKDTEATKAQVVQE